MPSRAIAAVAVALSLGALTSSAGAALTRVDEWLDVRVSANRFYCVTLPFRNATEHRVKLVPRDVDADLYLYGYNGSWVYITSSANSGTANDVAIFNKATRDSYNTINACIWGFGGNSRPDLFYNIQK